MYPIDWEQKKPDLETETDPWRDVMVESLSVGDARVHALVEQLHLVNSPRGGAECACFRLGEHSALDWFGARRRLQLTNFFERFLLHPAVNNALPVLNITDPLLKVPNVRFGNPYTLDGVLAYNLVQGGAYKEFAGTPHEAKVLAGAFCSALWGERLGEIDVYIAYTAWTDWFWGNGWDCTWFVLDKRERRLWVLCKTDSETGSLWNRWQEPTVASVFKNDAIW